MSRVRDDACRRARKRPSPRGLPVPDLAAVERSERQHQRQSGRARTRRWRDAGDRGRAGGRRAPSRLRSRAPKVVTLGGGDRRRIVSVGCPRTSRPRSPACGRARARSCSSGSTPCRRQPASWRPGALAPQESRRPAPTPTSWSDRWARSGSPGLRPRPRRRAESSRVEAGIRRACATCWRSCARSYEASVS